MIAIRNYYSTGDLLLKRAPRYSLLGGSMYDKRLDALILPLARSFDGKSPDLERWLREERQAYADEVKKTGATGLIVNLLENPSEPEASFGGAMIVDPNGEILAESTHGTDEMLIYDLVPIAPNAAS